MLFRSLFDVFSMLFFYVLFFYIMPFLYFCFSMFCRSTCFVIDPLEIKILSTVFEMKHFVCYKKSNFQSVLEIKFSVRT